MFSNGLSSSAADTEDFPAVVTMADNIRAQHRLLTEHFGVTRMAAAYGFSMGAGQAYHWAALYPGPRRACDRRLRERANLPCTTRCSCPGCCARSRRRQSTRATAGSAPSRRRRCARSRTSTPAGASARTSTASGLYETVLGAPDLETFLKTDWEDSFGACKAANLYAQAVTWAEADISNNDLYHGDLPAALSAIRAKVLLLPSETDLYFRVADNEEELSAPARRPARSDSEHLGTSRGQPGGDPGGPGVPDQPRARLAGQLASRCRFAAAATSPRTGCGGCWRARIMVESLRYSEYSEYSGNRTF